MSLYGDQNVTTMYIDPVTFVPGARATFELDGTKLAYLPNMRLLNVGYQHTDGAANYIFNPLVGAYGAIQTIRLLDGTTELSALNEAGLYRAFLNINKRNDEIISTNKLLQRSGLGWSTDNTSMENSDDKLYETGVVDEPSNRVSQNNVPEDNARLGYLMLAEVFPLLATISHLPTTLFKNLRLEVVYLRNIGDNNGFDPKPPAGGMAGVRPVLAVDVLHNPTIVSRLNKSLENATWLEVEHDLFRIPATAGDGAAGDQNVIQTINQKINGFNNKRLQRLLLVKQIRNAAAFQPTDTLSGFGIFGSQNLYKESLQIRVNGRNIFPRAGLVGDNERLAVLSDNFGHIFSYPTSNTQGVNGDELVQDGGDNGFAAQLDYDGVLVSEYITDLQINIGRTGTEDAATLRPNTSAIDVHCFGEVVKTLRLTPGALGYSIGYAQ